MVYHALSQVGATSRNLTETVVGYSCYWSAQHWIPGSGTTLTNRETMRTPLRSITRGNSIYGEISMRKICPNVHALDMLGILRVHKNTCIRSQRKYIRRWHRVRQRLHRDSQRKETSYPVPNGTPTPNFFTLPALVFVPVCVKDAVDNQFRS